MKRKEFVLDVMTSTLITLDKSKQKICDAKDIFNKVSLRNIPVMEGGKLIGIISKNAVKRLCLHHSTSPAECTDKKLMEMLTIERIMTKHEMNVKTCTAIKEVANIFIQEDFHAMPVMEDDKLVGIVTSTDIIKYLLDELERIKYSATNPSYLRKAS